MIETRPRYSEDLHHEIYVTQLSGLIKGVLDIR
jgi:hypothetical protein